MPGSGKSSDLLTPRPAAPPLENVSALIGAAASAEDRLQLGQSRVAREITSHFEPEMIVLADGRRSHDLVHHPIERRAGVPRSFAGILSGVGSRDLRQHRDELE